MFRQLYVRFFLLIISVFTIVGSLCGQGIDQNEPVVFLVDTIIAMTEIPASKIYIFCDSTGQLSFDEVRNTALFQSVPTGFMRQAGLTYWLKFSIENRTARQQNLTTYPGKSEYIELYQFDPHVGDFMVRKNGRRVPYPERDIQGFTNYGNYIRLDLPADTTTTFYAKTLFERYFYVVPEVVLHLYERDAAASYQYFSNIIAAIFIGALLVMWLYTSLLALTIRDKVYYYYVGFIFFAMLFYTYFYGFTIEWLWPKMPVWDIYSFVFILSGTYFFWINFGRGFLNTRQNLKKWDGFLKTLAWLHLVPSVVIFLDIAGVTSPYFLKQLSDIHNLLGILTLLSIFLVGWTAYRKKIRSARFFLGANIALLAGTMVLILRFLGFFEETILVMNAAQIGFFLQLILFSLGLGDRINRMRAELIQKDLEKVKIEQIKEQEKIRLIEEKNLELEEKVKERTRDVEAQKLEIEQKASMLETSNVELMQVNQFKDRLFSIIGHDLRNPIGALRGILELLKSGALTREEMISVSKELDVSLQGVVSTLDNLLIWALQQMDKMGHHPVSCNVHALVDENINLMAVKSVEKRIKVKNEIGEDVRVMADMEMLRLVIRNLLSNALKFTPQKGEIRFFAQTENGHYNICVQDTGTGIEETVIPQLFGSELYSSRGTDNERGTGLGLKLCRDFVEKNKGKITVESKQGQGSTFKVSLPVAGTS